MAPAPVAAPVPPIEPLPIEPLPMVPPVELTEPDAVPGLIVPFVLLLVLPLAEPLGDC
jgi:hypothetical protein